MTDPMTPESVGDDRRGSIPESAAACCRACYYGHPNECEREKGSTVGLYVSKPQTVEAVQWTGDWDAVENAIDEKVRLRGDAIELLAGKDGAQEWVPVPLGHWLVHLPSDLSDVWPVDPDYFAGKYDRADA